MRVTVIGAGHVGLVTAACLAHVGHDVVVDDDDVSKLDLIREGRSWFFEPGLEELLGEVVRAGPAPDRRRQGRGGRATGP